jgi:hypothetical protein
MGAYWYGQWHEYKFNYYNANDGVENSGDQSLFYSNAELRLGLEF